MTERVESVVIVGASLAGFRTYTSLRREGFEGRVTLIGDEPHRPYDRPPLSKQFFLGNWDADRLTLPDFRDTEGVDENLTLVLGTRVVALDVERRMVTTETGLEYAGDVVVVATGTRARTLPFSAASRLHTVRTLNDTMALQQELQGQTNDEPVVVIGAGFIGAEIATGLQSLGRQTLVLEAQERPLDGVLGSKAAELLETLPNDFGVTVRCGIRIQDVIASGNGLEVTTDQGAFTAASGVLGVGAVPNVEWLEGSNLTLDNGVVVDERLQAAPGVYAVGDVAKFPLATNAGVEMARIEHWQVAVDHAGYVAQAIAGRTDGPFRTVPYFWSDQYGKKIQMLGHPGRDDTFTLRLGSVEEGKWVADYSRDGVLTGVLALNNPRELMLSKSLLDPLG